MVYCAQGRFEVISGLCQPEDLYVACVFVLVCQEKIVLSCFRLRELTSCCYLRCEDVTPELAKLGIHTEGVGTVNSNSYHGNQYQAQTIS